MAKQTGEIIYVGDPMCSWCWGFAPVLDAIRERYADRFAFRVVVGGLRPGPHAEPLDDRLGDFLRREWTHIREVTKQPFDTGFLARDGFVYDTHPAACAVVTMRRLRPAVEFDFFKAVQKAFYADGVDVTLAENLGLLGASFGLEAGSFADSVRSDEATQAAVADYREARKLGVTGFPSVLLEHGGRIASLTHGYQPFAALKPLLDRAVEALGQAPDGRRPRGVTSGGT